MLSKDQLISHRRFLGAFIVMLTLSVYPGLYAIQDDSGSPPDLVVGIVVDKMRYDYISRMWDNFGEGGFRRLVSQGTSFTSARYDYLVNQSSAGYATIFTGANPSTHGIIADRWYDRITGNILSSAVDETVAAVGGSFDNGKRSPVRLMSTTIGDQLRLSGDFKSRVYSVSLNDAAAVLSGGFSANSAWWFDNVNGGWMSSSFYIDSIPGWVNEFNAVMLPDVYLDRRWEPLLDHTLYFGLPNEGREEPFRYDLRRMQRRRNDYGLLNAVPYGNTFTRDFAVSLMINENLGRNGHTDMLIIGFSAAAEIGRQYGAFSQELQDAYLRLDIEISGLLDFLEQQYGKSNVLVFLTSDQAVSYPSGYKNSARVPGGTFSPSMAMSLLRSYLNITYGNADWVSYYNAGMVYLNTNLIEDNNLPLAEIQNRASRFLNQFSGVAGSLTDDVLLRNHFTDGISSRVQAGFHAKRSGDIMIFLQPGWYERSLVGEEVKLVSYEQHVPLILYGWNISSGQTLRRQLSIIDIAPTLAMMLNIPPPPFATGKPVMELIK